MSQEKAKTKKSSDSTPSHAAYNAGKRWEINAKKRQAKAEREREKKAAKLAARKCAKPKPKVRAAVSLTTIQKNLDMASKMLHALKKSGLQHGRVVHAVVTNCAKRGMQVA